MDIVKLMLHHINIYLYIYITIYYSCTYWFVKQPLKLYMEFGTTRFVELYNIKRYNIASL